MLQSQDKEIINAAKKYHTKMSLHWIRPKSKAPFENNWSKLPRANWEKLKSTFKPGMNLGVRLGSATPLGKDKFLAVIDCDVKGGDRIDREEMLSTLKKLLPEFSFSTALQVLSGRGNGSMHIYCATIGAQNQRRLAQAPRQVKVLMPSSGAPTPNDRKHLNDAELKAGYRMRAAWEISLLGEGQQTVLPPSAHADTGAIYKWRKEFEPSKLGDLPVLDVSKLVGVKKEKSHLNGSAALSDFKFVDVDLVGSQVSARMVGLIISGEGCEGDKSASLFGACLAMSQAGLSEIEILSVLTDTDNYLGEVGFRHTKSENRQRAATWIKKYCLDKAVSEKDAARDFEVSHGEDIGESGVPTPSFSDEAAREQEGEIKSLAHWQSQIERSDPRYGNKPKNTLKNVQLILRKAIGEKIFVRNEFTCARTFGSDFDLLGVSIANGKQVTDSLVSRIKLWMATFYELEPSTDRIEDAIKVISDTNKFHPVRDYLDTLEWDGVPRLDNWLFNYTKAVGPKEYVQAVGRKVLTAMVARIYKPAIKFDYVLILQGPQGMRKSTCIETLATTPWFTDSKIDVNDKDSVMKIAGKWAVELSELAGLNKADLEKVKSFISTKEDRIRQAYGKHVEDFPRQSIFIGSTNEHEYLRDSSGNRRFWPVSVGACDIEALEQARDQLLAEAKTCFELGEPLWLEDKAVEQMAIEEQEQRMQMDPWQEKIEEWMSKKENEKDAYTTNEFFDTAGPIGGEKADMQNAKRLSAVLRKMGFKNVRKREGQKQARFWSKTTPENSAEV